MRRTSVFLALAIFGGGIGPAAAQTMSYAEGISQVSTVCRSDIARFCRGVPLGPRLRACFDANEARMSPPCRQTAQTVYASITRRAAAQRDIGEVCSADIMRLTPARLLAICDELMPCCASAAVAAAEATSAAAANMCENFIAVSSPSPNRYP